MSTWLLFCTAAIPMVTIDRVIDSQKHNFFSLVRNPEQITFDDPTPTPIQSFTTGFVNWTSEQIRDFVAQRFPERIEGTNIERGNYAILDQTSYDTDTVIIAHSYSPLLQRDIDEMTEEEREEWENEIEDYNHDNATDTQWAQWRVKVKDVWDMSSTLEFESDFTPKLYNPNYVARFTDNDGVLQYDSAFQVYVQENEAQEEEEEEEGRKEAKE